MNSLHVYIHGEGFVKIEGDEWEIEPVSLPHLRYLELYAHKAVMGVQGYHYPHRYQYSLTEARSGCKLGKPGYIPAILDSASARAKARGKKKVLEIRDAILQQHGEAPKEGDDEKDTKDEGSGTTVQPDTGADVAGDDN